jgi:hypothetical protein
MRGYHRRYNDQSPYPTPAKTREETAEHIAQGHPSPVTYESAGKLPVNLWPRDGGRDAEEVRFEDFAQHFGND